MSILKTRDQIAISCESGHILILDSQLSKVVSKFQVPETKGSFHLLFTISMIITIATIIKIVPFHNDK